MDTFISADVRKGLERARRRATKSGNRLCVHTNGNVFVLLKHGQVDLVCLQKL